jgi:hypothetical protein
MFLTRPPITNVRILLPSKGAIKAQDREFRLMEAVISDPEGLKIEAVLDTIIEYADTEYLQMAPYAVQASWRADNKGSPTAIKKYRTLLHQHWCDWGHLLVGKELHRINDLSQQMPL